MKVRYHLEIGNGEGQYEVVELPDNFTEEDIEEDFLEWRAGYLDSCWEILDDNNT